jgi:hypothetical protein
MSLSLLVYLSILAGSSLFFLSSLIFGDGDSDHDGADHTMIDHGHGGDHDSGNAFKEIFSIRNIFLFGVGFGAAGSISAVLGQGFIFTTVMASAFGLATARVGFKMVRFFYRREMCTVNSLTYLHGEEGHVTVMIPTGGFGEVVASDGMGQTVFSMAKSSGGETIPVGSRVLVETSEDGVVYVKEIKQLNS